MEKITANNKIMKLISAFLIISIITPAILFSSPKKAEAIPVAVISDNVNPIWGWLTQAHALITSVSTVVNTAFSANQWALKIGEGILRVVAKRLLAQMTQATINWINEDFHGSPLFLENPQSFFKDIAKSEVRNMVDMIGYDSLRYPFGGQVALNVMDSYRRQFATNAQYTLSKVINDPDLLRRYQNDFDYGGWNGFLINTQYPQNNYLGFKMMVEDNLASRLEGTMVPPAQRIKETLQQGMGFLSPQKCPSNPRYNNGFNEFQKPTFDDAKYEKEHPLPKQIDVNSSTTAEDLTRMQNENEQWLEDKTNKKEEWAIINTCPGGLVNTTPGSVAASQISNQLDSPRLMTALDGALGNSIAAIFDALLNHFFEKGLNALADFVNPPPSNDNWSYGGGFLDDSYIPIPGSLQVGNQPGDINVSVEIGKTTSERISGGNGDYGLKKLDETDKTIVFDEEDKTIDTIAIVKINISGSSGNKLEITGVKKGNGVFTVEDSSNSNQSVAVNVNVGDAGGLLVSPASISTNSDSNNQTTATISGGEKLYSLLKGPDENIAIAKVADNKLIIIGIKNGATSVEIRDSSTPEKTVKVDIKVGPDATTALLNVSINIDEIISIAAILDGTPLYVVTRNENAGVATAEISYASPTMLTIRGVAPGRTTVTVQDSSNPIKTANIIITTIDPNILPPDYYDPVYAP